LSWTGETCRIPRTMNSARQSKVLPVTLWVLLCALLSAAGWILSALHALNRTGYLVVFALAAVAVWILCRYNRISIFPEICISKSRRRFTRLLPAGFAVVAGLAILGGVLHPPSNYDALAYRVPRVLHWLAAEQWHWIHTDFQRLNTRAAGFEWVAVPLTTFLQTDRWWFLINVASSLLLPGLVFSLYTRLGVSRRVAWSWMWLLPTGYSFVLQAGGIGNDLFGAVFALAALDFALRARMSGRFNDAAVSCLAAALLTASKTSNLPLGLPWAVAILPCWRLFIRKPTATLVVAAVALLSSFLPTAVMNHRYAHDWTGAHAENMFPDRYDPRVTIPGNVMVLTVQNFAPPICPQAGKWNAFAPRFMTKEFHERMKKHFEPSGANLAITELQNEEFSGFGFGLSCLVVISQVASWLAGRTAKSPVPNLGVLRASRWVRWSPWLSAFVYLAKTAIGTAARIFTPYYLLLLPVLLAGRGHAVICRRKWWRCISVAVFLFAAALVILTPSRPLWPAKTILSALSKRYPNNALIERSWTVFSVYGERADGLATVRRALPTDHKVIGLITLDDPEASLWRPFGSRRFEHVIASDTRAQLLARGIHYIALNADTPSMGGNVQPWLDKIGGQIEQHIRVRYRAASGAFDWYVVRLDAPATKPGK